MCDLNTDEFIDYLFDTVFYNRDVVMTEELLKALKKRLFVLHNLCNILYYKSIYAILEETRNSKYNQVRQNTTLMVEFNNFIDGKHGYTNYNDRFGEPKKKIYTLELLKTSDEIPWSTVNTTNIPFNVFNNFFRESKFFNANPTDEAIKFPINGFLVFFCYRRTLTLKKENLCVLYNNSSNVDLQVVNIDHIIKHQSSDLCNNISFLFQNNLEEDWYYETKDMKEDCLDIQVGYIATLSASKTDLSKHNILDILYYYNSKMSTQLYIHLYAKMVQFKTQPTIVSLFNNKEKEFIHQNCKMISCVEPFDTTVEIPSHIPFFYYEPKLKDLKMCLGKDYLVYTYNAVDYNNDAVLYKNFNNYLTDSKKVSKYVTVNKSKSINIAVQKRLIIKDNNEYKTEYISVRKNIMLKDLIYSNFLNRNKTFGFDKIFILNKGTFFLLDIIQKRHEFYMNPIKELIEKIYIVKNNTIIIKRNFSAQLEFLSSIDPDSIDWYHLFTQSKALGLQYSEDKNIVDWFKEVFLIMLSKQKEYKLTNDMIQNYKNTFNCLTISELFAYLFKDNEKDEYDEELELCNHRINTDKYKIDGYHCYVLPEIEMNDKQQSVVNIINLKLFFNELDNKK